MNRVFVFVCAALVTALLSNLLRKNAPETAVLLGIALLAAVLSALTGDAVAAAEEMQSIMQRAGIRGEIFLPLLRVLGISAVTGAAGAVCSDAGEKAAAFLLHLAGTVCSFAAVLPLVHEVVEMLLEYL